jgi:hypothetical protein
VNPFVRLPLCPFTVTVTVTAPAPAGVVAVIVVPFTTTTLVAAVAPNFTVAPAAKFVPVIVTAVPPAAGPLFGDTLLTVTATADVYVNALAKLPFWLFTVTVTVTAPAAFAGVVAVIVVLLTTVTFVAAVPPKVTIAPKAKFVPVIVTAVPPAVDPLFGLTLLTVGTGPETAENVAICITQAPAGPNVAVAL